jgi:hypothetical protein
MAQPACKTRWATVLLDLGGLQRCDRLRARDGGGRQPLETRAKSIGPAVPGEWLEDGLLLSPSYSLGGYRCGRSVLDHRQEHDDLTFCLDAVFQVWWHVNESAFYRVLIDTPQFQQSISFQKNQRSGEGSRVSGELLARGEAEQNHLRSVVILQRLAQYAVLGYLRHFANIPNINVCVSHLSIITDDFRRFEGAGSARKDESEPRDLAPDTKRPQASARWAFPLDKLYKALIRSYD